MTARTDAERRTIFTAFIRFGLILLEKGLLRRFFIERFCERDHFTARRKRQQ